MKDEARALKVTTAGLKVFERNDKKASPTCTLHAPKSM